MKTIVDLQAMVIMDTCPIDCEEILFSNPWSCPFCCKWDMIMLAYELLYDEYL